MIRFSYIDYAIAGKSLLKDVSGQFEPGKFHALIGPNGAGKSTLLKVLSGLVAPLGGQVTFRGRSLAAWKERDLARNRAFLEQTIPDEVPFRVAEIIEMGRYPYGKEESKALRRNIALRLATQTQVEHLLHRQWQGLSGGERQRVQLARVLTQLWTPEGYSSKVLFLDEPLNNLDIAFQHLLLNIVREFIQSGGTVISVLHDINLTARFADSCLLLQNGRKVVQGPVKEVLVPAWLEPVFEVQCNQLARPDGSFFLEFSPLHLPSPIPQS